MTLENLIYNSHGDKLTFLSGLNELLMDSKLEMFELNEFDCIKNCLHIYLVYKVPGEKPWVLSGVYDLK